MIEIKRPLLRYHGGKFMLAKWIISHFPKHKVYVEPYGGAASVLLQKKPVYAEIYNDLDNEVVNLFSVVRNSGELLIKKLENTPFARSEFDLSYLPTDDPLEQARRTVVRSFMGFGSAAASGQKTGFRANSNRSGTTPSHDWANLPKSYYAIIERMKGVVIENRDAISIMKQHDGENTLIYLDPPYTLNQRYEGQKTKCYNFEMSNEEHEQLCNSIIDMKAMFVLSGYDNPIYNDILKGWSKVYRKSFADGARERIEVLWLSQNCARSQELKLF